MSLNMRTDGDAPYMEINTPRSDIGNKTTILDVCHLGWCRWRYVFALVAVVCVIVLVVQLVSMHRRLQDLEQAQHNTQVGDRKQNDQMQQMLGLIQFLCSQLKIPIVGCELHI